MQHAYVIFTKARLDRIQFADGSIEIYPLGQGQAAYDDLLSAARLPYEEWSRSQPSFWSEAHRAEQWRQYDQGDTDTALAPAGSVETVRGWRGYLADAGDVRPLTGLIENWPVGGVPATDIAQALDVLSTQGWQVISASEDKGLYIGADAAREAGPVTVRILVSRPRDSLSGEQ